MPELPEVETLARDLRKAVAGRTIIEAWVSPEAPRLVQELTVATFADGLRGRRIEGTERRGKYLLIGLSADVPTDPSTSPPRLPLPHSSQDDKLTSSPRAHSRAPLQPHSSQDDKPTPPARARSRAPLLPLPAQDDRTGLWWIVHRRMSGNFLQRPADAPDEPYLRARFRLDDGSELRFIDLRKFGTMWLTDDPAPILAGLGPEPLDAAFTDEVLAEILSKRSAPVKAVLLDQSAIAGIGNLYADEALHYARIHPLRPASSLTKDEVSRLREGIVGALDQGLRNLGSSVGHEAGEEVSLRDHVNLSGEAGGNQEYLVAYGREGRPCRNCGTPIERLKISNRSASYCPTCQAQPRQARKSRKIARGSKLEVRSPPPAQKPRHGKKTTTRKA